MIKFILMLLGLTFGHNNINTSLSSNEQQQTQLVVTDPNLGNGVDPNGPGPGNGGSTGGNTGQTPPPFIQP